MAIIKRPVSYDIHISSESQRVRTLNPSNIINKAMYRQDPTPAVAVCSEGRDWGPTKFICSGGSRGFYALPCQTVAKGIRQCGANERRVSRRHAFTVGKNHRGGRLARKFRGAVNVIILEIAPPEQQVLPIRSNVII